MFHKHMSTFCSSSLKLNWMIFVYFHDVLLIQYRSVHVHLILIDIFQTLVLALLMKYLGHKGAIMYGLVFEIVQLACYGFGSQDW